MTDQRKQVKAMISQVRARLVDLEEIVDAYEGDLAGYADKLDRVDDKIYLLEVELEKAAKKAAAADKPADEAEEGAAKADAQEAKAVDSDGSDDDEFDLPNAEEMKSTVRDLAGIAKEGKETFDELKDAFDDITSVFKDEDGNNKLTPYLNKAAGAASRYRRRW